MNLPLAAFSRACLAMVQEPLGPEQIFRRGHLDVAALSRNDADPDTQALHQGRVIGSRPIVQCRFAVKRPESNRRETPGVFGTSRHSLLTGQGLPHLPPLDSFDRIGGWNGGNGGVGCPRPIPCCSYEDSGDANGLTPS